MEINWIPPSVGQGVFWNLGEAVCWPVKEFSIYVFWGPHHLYSERDILRVEGGSREDKIE